MLMMQQFSKHVVRGKGEVSMTVSVSSANRINVLKVNIVRCSRTDRIGEAAGLKHDHTFKDGLWRRADRPRPHCTAEEAEPDVHMTPHSLFSGCFILFITSNISGFLKLNEVQIAVDT